MENVIIIGGGPAALTSAIYAGRADLNPLLFEGFMAGGVAAGGQLTTTTTVENFPGFKEPVEGAELVYNMREQAIANSTRIITETISSVDFSSKIKKVTTEAGKTYEAKSIIIATGSTAKTLPIENLDKFWNNGISACAVCDAALPIFRDGILYVVGGGDTAAEEASFLTKFGSQVFMLVRKDYLRASKAMQKKLEKNKKLKVIFNTEVLKADGDSKLDSLILLNNLTNDKTEVKSNGLFFAVGHNPNTEFLKDVLDLDKERYVISSKNKTSIEGVFCAGDVRDKVYRQAITAAGDGAKAALNVVWYLEDFYN